MMRLIVLISLCMGLAVYSAKSQQVLLEKVVNADGLYCFPVYGDSLRWVYLPPDANLSLNSDSLPQFSFLRYITEKPSSSDINTITEAGGGAIVNFMIEYNTPQQKVQNAQAFLRRKFKAPDIEITGPIVFTRGRYMLISSILLPDGKEDRKILGTGEAPILENSQIAFSFELDPVRSKLLLESFKMETPDISVMFELGFSGLTESYQAELEVDWTEVRKHKSFGAGASVYFIGADVELGFDDLIRNNAIKLNTVGTDPNLEGLLQTVYSKLLELMFKRVEPESVPQDSRGGLMDALAAATGAGGAMNSRNTTGFGLNVAFQLKEMKTSGKSNLFFRGRSSVERNHFITFNIGDLYEKHGDDDRMFRDVPLYDPAFQQRNILVGVDGSLEREFDKMVNSVTVKMRKKHEDGTTTIRELVVNRKVFTDSTGRFIFSYNNHGDSDLQAWLGYEYQTIWQFVGGGSYTSDWTKSEAAMINLFTPFQRRSISLEGDLEGVMADCRAISVRINYPFFSEQRKDDQTIRARDNLSEKDFEVTLPLGEDSINYEIIWIKKDGSRQRVSGVDNIGLLFIDELPED